MAIIHLADTFSLIPEGVHVLKITSVDYKQTFGKMEITLQTKEGQMHTERYSFIGSNGMQNDGAIKAFSYFARTALNDFTIKDIEHTQLVGKFIKAEVTHEMVESKKEPGKTIEVTKLGNKYPASGWEDTEIPAPAKQAPSSPVVSAETDKPKATKKFDLNALLG